MSVLLQTSFGDIVIDLFVGKAPQACCNFLKLCKIKHYNNTLFEQVQKNYVTKIKSKFPTTAWKQTGQSMSYFKDQIDVQAKVNALGLVATSNSGPNLNNSQFFITLTKANLNSLAGKHTVFGKVEQGFDVLRKINDTYVDGKNRPQMNIRIMHTFVLDDPFPELQKLRVPDRSPSPIKDSQRLQAIQHLQMLQKCKNQSEILQATKQQKAKKQAMTLQILGQLPDASLKPPQNILFVCKLNPITQQRDLQVIFSRFGPIKSVQIVRDWKTGQSLQYSFIEFENIASCQQAYLKMNNVIIDQRRIQVDFSQSVSKLLNRGKGGIMNNKPRFSQQQERKRQLVPKTYTQGKDKSQKFDLVMGKTQGKQHMQMRQERQQDTKERNQYYRQEKRQKKQKKNKHRSRSRDDSRRRKRSISSQQKRHKSKKHKQRRVSRSP